MRYEVACRQLCIHEDFEASQLLDSYEVIHILPVKHFPLSLPYYVQTTYSFRVAERNMRDVCISRSGMLSEYITCGVD